MPQFGCMKLGVINNQPVYVRYPPQKVSVDKTKLDITALIPATDLNKSPYNINKNINIHLS